MIKQIKQNIKQQIKAHNTTTAEVCDRMNEGRNYINRITDKVHAAKVIRIAHAIGCDPSELFKDL